MKEDDTSSCDDTQFVYTYQDQEHTGNNISTDNFNIDIYRKDSGPFGSSLELNDMIGDTTIKVTIRTPGIMQRDVGYTLENSQASFYNGTKFIGVEEMSLTVDKLSYRTSTVADTLAHFVTESSGTLNMKLRSDSTAMETFSLEYCFKLN